jgi:phage-related minor tail protein
MSDLKIQGEVSLDTSGADAAFARVEQSAGKMARGVQDQAGKAGKSINGMGDGGDQAAQKLDRSTKSIISSVQRATAVMEAGERGSAKYFETLANQRGANVDALRPYIAQLEAARAKQDAAAASLGRVGISAGQTSAALRGVPAQFTDIITSLQGGQAPLSVFLQQGGQLKDMFGGAGAAARALGGYIVGLVNPFTLAAAGAGVLALAYNQGANEAQNFRKQIILSGNAAGVTSDQLASMAKGTNAAFGTQGKASEVLSQLVSTGRVSRDILDGAKNSILAFSSATGASVEDLVKSFSTLGKDSAASILKLNEQYNFLTASTYEQITALEKQGRSEEAAALAQRTYSEMLGQRAKEVKDNLGLLEKAWGGLGMVAKGVWDSMLGVGREDTISEKIADLERRRDKFAANPGYNPGQSPRDAINDYNLKIGQLRTEQVTKESAAARQAAQVAIQNAGTDAAKAIEEQRKALASGSEKMAADLAKYRQNLDAVRKANPNSDLLDASKIAADEAAIREKYKDKGAARDSARAAREQNKELEQYRNLVNDLSGQQDGFSTSFNEQVATLTKGWRLSGDSLAVYDRAFEQLLKTQPFAIKAAKDLEDAQKKLASTRESDAKAAEQSAQGVAERVQALQDEEAAIVLARAGNISLSAAIEDVRIARLNEALAVSLSFGDERKAEALQAEISARKELAKLTDNKAGRDAASDAFKDFMKSDISTNFAAGFDKASASLGTFVQSFRGLIGTQEKYNKAKADAAGDTAKMTQLDRQYTRNQISGYAAMAGAAKGFFGEKTGAYKAMVLAEQSLRAIELASSIASIVESGTVGTAKAAVAVANQGTQGDPYTAIPRMAAVAAIMASLGFAVAGSIGGGSGSSVDAAAVQAAQGTGSVLGDTSAKSESIAKSLAYLEDVASPQLKYTAEMTAYLRSIDASLSGLSVQILRTGSSLTGAGFVSTKTNAKGFSFDGLGTVYEATKSLPGMQGSIAGRIVQSLLGSTKTSLQDSGVQFNAESLASVLAGGLDAFQYQVIKTTTSKMFGLSKSSKTSTQTAGIDSAITQQFDQLIKNLYNSVLVAGEAIGNKAEDLQARLLGLSVDLGRISLKGLTGDQIQEQLSSVFGAFGDRLAAAADSSLLDFQQVGEGYFETLIRVASGFEEGSSILRRLGVDAVALADIEAKQGNVAAELVRQSILAAEGVSGLSDVINGLSGDASEIASTYKTLGDIRVSLGLLGLEASAVSASLIDGAGGLSELADAVSAFESGFLTNSEQIANNAERMALQFDKLGVSLPTSGDAFVALVKGIDTSTDAGKTLLGGLLGLSSGFADLLSSIEDVGSGIAEEIARIKGLSSTSSAQSFAELQSSFAINTAKARSGDQAAIDLLPSISQALIKTAEATATSSIDAAVIQAQTLASLQTTLDLIKDPTKYLKGYAGGGTFSGGYRIVGENGPEIEATGPSRIFDASQTARILSGAGSDSELRALRLELAAYREEQRIGMAAVAANTGKTARTLDGVTQDGTALVTVAA